MSVPAYGCCATGDTPPAAIQLTMSGPRSPLPRLSHSPAGEIWIRDGSLPNRVTCPPCGVSRCPDRRDTRTRSLTHRPVCSSADAGAAWDSGRLIRAVAGGSMRN
jgi:hypothetical protein